ncbi:hypothetical protein ACFSJU_19130 [Paradesertivirga mongoliensis]|uniref:Uncharacterized protein n=1 Tax=Paradesertivirga mongoliensis TaxID=2100740 RepID=A0ABW4ZSL0_9SPHI|nr:hypothetical protein [Pedobacter mongoliensis]
MKVSEKSNGAVHSTEERREEAVQTQTASPKPTAGANGQKDKEPLKLEDGKNPEKLVLPEKVQEPSKDEVKVNEPFIKPALNLESTLKVVNDLHRRCIQRENLLTRINQLEAFEIALIEEGDELESNHFQGCKLMIVDDKNRQFITTTSGLIKLVAEFIHNACLSKLGEIESNIVFPRP